MANYKRLFLPRYHGVRGNAYITLNDKQTLTPQQYCICITTGTVVTRVTISKNAYVNIKSIEGNMILGNDLTKNHSFIGTLGMIKVFYQTIDYLTRQVELEEYNKLYNFYPLESIPL